MTELIKQDINFLEYPMYVLAERTAKENIDIVIEDKEYNLLVGYKTPNSIDVLYLYYFIKVLQKNDYSKHISIKQSTLIKEVSNGCSSFYYSRLKESLKIWRNIGLSFKGSFYDGKSYQVMEFGILESGRIEDDGTVHIEFNHIFLDILKNTNFYRYINFNEFKALRKPISRRLYEILKKSSFPYKIDLFKLAKKMPLRQKFASQIIQKLKPAIKDINKYTSLNIQFSYQKNLEGNVICVFDEINNSKNNPALESGLEETEELLNLIPENKKSKRVSDLIQVYINENTDKDYIKYNIIYSVKNSSKNFYLYLANSLKNDYAKDFREFEKLNVEIIEKQRQLELEIKIKDDEYSNFTEICNGFISSLSDEKYKEYEVLAKEEILKEWKEKGFDSINSKTRIPQPCIREKIFRLYGTKKPESLSV